MTNPSADLVPSIISVDVTVKGDLSSTGEIHIDGTVEGDVTYKSLIIGEDGSVNGQINAEIVRIHGSVRGRLQSKSVFLASTAEMFGDVAHESLAIEPGAFIEGHCQGASAENANLSMVFSRDEPTAGETNHLSKRVE